MPVARTLDDLPPVAARSRTVPGAPASAAVQPHHLAPQAKPAQSAQNAAKSHLAAGTVIDGKYAIVRLLGQGGMGVVYLARDIHTGMDVVLKSVRTELAHRADVRARTLAEGRVLGQIDHPNVVHLKAVVVEDTALWLVMQYIEGESLDRTIDRTVAQKQPMPLADALRLFRQIASGIEAAHAEGIIHRDLKPANVLIRAKDQVAKVTDFGIAKAEHDTGQRRVQTRGVIGSVWYMSPEQVTGRRDLDKRVDIYALGIVLYQMLTGRVPFDAESDYEVMRAQAEMPLPRAAALRPDVPPAIDDFLQKLCAKDRDARYQTCEEVLHALTAIEAALAAPAAPALTAAPAVTAASEPAPAPAEDLGPTADLGPLARPSSRPPPAAEPRASAGPSAPPPVSASAAGSTDGSAAPKAAASKSATPKDETAPAVASTRDGAPLAEADSRAPAKPSRTGLWVGLGLVVAAGTVAALVATGVIPEPARWLAAPASATGSTTPAPSAPPSSAPSSPADSPSSSSAAAEPASPMDRLLGTWIGGDRVLEAVKVADSVELRVTDPAQFAPADYEAGEPRVVLRAIPGEDAVFSVEDRLRPEPPIQFPFDRARARPTCQEVRADASGIPLRATLDGDRLSVELIKIEPTGANFVLENGKAVSCRGLAKLRASKVVSVLSRK
ncbi:MAG: serine/threonine-protein kinase [Polyangiaceae bacterium]